MKKFTEIKKLSEFEREFKKLLKKFQSLDEDLDVFINKQLVLTHKLGVDNGGVVRIAGLGIDEPKVYKAKKFACKSLKGKGAQSGIRIIYSYSSTRDVVEFVEIYYKGDKENEDRARIVGQYR